MLSEMFGILWKFSERVRKSSCGPTNFGNLQKMVRNFQNIVTRHKRVYQYFKIRHGCLSIWIISFCVQLYISVARYPYLFFSEASQRSGILNPWLWLANSARSSGPDFPVRTPRTDRSEFSNIATIFCGLGPYSKPRAQFFPIRTSRPANNIYLRMPIYF